MADSNNMRVLLMTGLAIPDKGATTTEQQQVDFFKKGFGDDIPIDQYSYKNTTGLTAAIKKYPDAIVVLYSAGGKRADKIAPIIPTKEKLFVVEPWCGGKTQSSERIKIMTTAMASGVPPTNFQTGPVFNRGKGIPGSTSTPTGDNHFAALTYAGGRIRSMYPNKVVEEPVTLGVLDTPSYVVYTTNSTVDGDIYFKQEEEGYVGEMYLENFPPEANVPINEVGIVFSTDYIEKANFDLLKDDLLKKGQKWLDDLKFFDGNEGIDVGELKVGAENGVRYVIKGKVVNETSPDEPVVGALIKDSTSNPDNNTRTQSDGSFILHGYYISTYVAAKISNTPTFNLVDPNNPNLKGTVKIDEDGQTALLKAKGEWLGKPFTIEKSYTKPKVSLIDYDPEDDEFDKFEGLINGVIVFAIEELSKTIEYTGFWDAERIPPKDLKPPRKPEFTINISAPDFSQKDNISPFFGDGSIKPSLGVIGLKPTIVELKQKIREESNFTQPQVKNISKFRQSASAMAQKALNRIVIEAKTKLLPSVLVMISEFGITNINAVLGKEYKDMNAICPMDSSQSGDSLAKLTELIQKKNNLTRALNKMYKALQTIKLGVETTDKIVVASEVVIVTLQALASIPSTVATPIPSITSNIIEEIKRQIKRFKLITGTTLLTLNLLIQTIQTILNYLNLLDTLLQGCIQDYLDTNPDADLPTQNQINQDLLNATIIQAEQLSPVVTNVNGFDMAVITEDGKTELDLKRRRAVAKNKAGIIMLRGEPSFSSNDQILIDELVFYIQQNDLKAE